MEREKHNGKIINWVTDNPVKTIGLAILIAFLPLFVVLILLHFAEAQKATSAQIDWIRTNLLSYLGTVLTFLGTITLSTIAVWQNKEHSKRVYELQKQIHEQEVRRQSPKFLIVERGSNGSCMNLILDVRNVSSLTVSSFKFTGLFGMLDGIRQGDNLLKTQTRPTAIRADEKLEFSLSNTVVSEPQACLEFECLDALGEKHFYKGTRQTSDSKTEFAIREINLK